MLAKGVSIRNTARYIRKHGAPHIEVKEPQMHIHPRGKREELCPCGYPINPCTSRGTDGGNYCARRDGWS